MIKKLLLKHQGLSHALTFVSELQTKSFHSFFGGSTDFCQTGRGSGLTVAFEAHWDSSHSPGASVADVCSGRGFEEHLDDATNAVTFT